jgi:hypothetical protein
LKEAPKSLARVRRGSLGGIAALAFAAAIALPPTASASDVTCGGIAKRSTAPAATANQLDYSVHCTAVITSYSIVANLPIDAFGAETSVTPAPDGSTGKLFSCEGRIPSNGFGCNGGNLPTGAYVNSTLTPQFALCASPKHRLRLWVVGVDTKGGSSGPFMVRVPKCPKPKAKPKRTKRHAHR